MRKAGSQAPFQALSGREGSRAAWEPTLSVESLTILL